MGLLVAQGARSGDDLAHIGLSAHVSVEVKEGEEIFDLSGVEGRIGSDDGLAEDGLAFVFNDSLAINAHPDISAGI